MNGADGDSFPVIITENGKPREIIARLYYVDCPETSGGNKTDNARLLEQFRYFGIDNKPKMPLFGIEAKERTRELLSKPFEVHTSFANAMGRSRMPRNYAMIKLKNGEFLSTVLISEGLARVKGRTHILLDGSHSKDFREKLSDLELAATIDKKGIWADSTSAGIVKLREKARIAAAKVTSENPFALVTKDNPADINNGKKEILEAVKGIGPATAEKIINARPFKSVEDLLRVNGLAEQTLEKIRPFIVCKPTKN